MARPLKGMGRLGSLVLLLLVAAVFLREAVQAKTAPSRGRVDRVGRSGSKKRAAAGRPPRRRRSSRGGVEEALKRAQVEQSVEDYNALLPLEGGGVFTSSPSQTPAEGVRGGGRFLVMPSSSDLLDPPLGTVLHGKLQYSDKVMLPKSFLYEVLTRKLEPPWMFEIQPVREEEDGQEDEDGDEEEEEEEQAGAAAGRKGGRANGGLKRLYATYWDFRAPENYLFVPDWMMRTLRLRPRDVVKVRHVKLPDGGLMVFRPRSAEFGRLANAHAVLEAELKYYSAIAMGTTVVLRYNNKDYELDVVETRDPNDVIVPAIRVQDSDVRTEIKTSLEEERAAAAAKLKQEQEEERRKKEQQAGTEAAPR